MTVHVLDHRFHSPLVIAYRLLKGNTLMRALLNRSLERHGINGEVLDLGSKSNKASYYAHLRSTTSTRITFTDMRPATGLVALDVEAPFEISENSFDTVLAFNLFEHVFHFQRAPSEVYRVLKPGGRVLVAVPFLHEYHADPDDYVRFTDSGLKRIWESAGFHCTHIEAIGEGLLTAVLTKLPTQILPKQIRPAVNALLYLLATPLDRLIAMRPRIDGRSVPQRFALEYFAVFEKPPAE